MKKIILVLILLFIFTACDNSETPELKENEDYIDLSQTYDNGKLTYNNNLWYINSLDKVPLPDPYVYEHDDTYYIIGTSDRDINVVDCYTTIDFVNFEAHYGIFKPKDFDGWENDNPQVYAPELYNFNGIYYLYYSANDETNYRRNSVVMSRNILGPYEPIVNSEVDGLNNPLFYNEEYPDRALDATIFLDDDNKSYIYFAVTGETQHIVGMELLSPYQADWQTYTELVKPGYASSTATEQTLEWEIYRKGKISIAEAPFMLKSNGRYYMTYSVNGCWNRFYNVCYAVSDSPLGNFIKPYEENKIWTNLLLGYPGEADKDSLVYQQWSGYSSGTAHHCFFKIGEQLMIGYHGHQNRNWDGEQFVPRYFAFDYVYFDDNGVPYCNGPTAAIQPLPERISGYKNIMSNSTIKTTNISNPEGINDNYIVDCYNLDDINKEVGVNLDGSNLSTIEITFDKEYLIAGIAIYNSAYYENTLFEIASIDFGNGNVINDIKYCEDLYYDEVFEFVYPVSAINVELIKEIRTNSIIITIDLPYYVSLNEIVVLGA